MTRVFISYRRADSSGWVSAMDRRLSEALGRDNVFCDVKSIGPGSDFELDIRQGLAECDVVLVVIGQLWATVRSGRNRRLTEPDDLVRKEVEYALARDRVVVPVLVGNGALPAADELPPRMRKLLKRNAYVLSEKHFDADLDDLIRALKRLDAREPPEATGDRIAGDRPMNEPTPQAEAPGPATAGAPEGLAVAQSMSTSGGDRMTTVAADSDDTATPRVLNVAGGAPTQVDSGRVALMAALKGLVDADRDAAAGPGPGIVLRLAVTKTADELVFELIDKGGQGTTPEISRIAVGHSALTVLMQRWRQSWGYDDCLEVGAVLYRLLIPHPLRPLIEQCSRLELQLDVDADRLPWESLRPHATALPLGLALTLTRAPIGGLPSPPSGIRSEARALVILGDPEDGIFAPLPAAEDEAKRVGELLSGAAFDTDCMLRPDLFDALKALTLRPQRAVHLTGHSANGWLPDAPVSGSGEHARRPLTGFLVAYRAVLTPRELTCSDRVPELVTLGTDSIAHWGLALLSTGCRVVVAADGGLEDAAGRAFFITFYERLCAGADAGTAMRHARLSALGGEFGNALRCVLDLRCYGDADYRLVTQLDDDGRAIHHGLTR